MVSKYYHPNVLATIDTYTHILFGAGTTMILFMVYANYNMFMLVQSKSEKIRAEETAYFFRFFSSGSGSLFFFKPLRLLIFSFFPSGFLQLQLLTIS